ncbi:hypothetical protein [Sphingobacterium hungaricum]|uniref:GLPGLI family protein n=1 Tax=Sphingobacterium hungaricum TaxID=2082723 RepID=A0A928URN4_9SPHI|nr:hypothetical protein [Sphingobacterium hungaricum]MBE8712066.1 hypothetical protein [Sphingobacterium hungaricum]
MKAYRLVALLLSILLRNTIFAQKDLFKDYIEGHYYTYDGQKVSGLLKFNITTTPYVPKDYGTCFIYFKKDENDKRIKLKSDEVSKFVMDLDSFVVLQNFEFKDVFRFRIIQDFVKVFAEGKINVYSYYAQRGTGNPAFATTVNYLFYTKDGSPPKYLGQGKKFKENVLEIIKDYPELYSEAEKLPKGSFFAMEFIQRYNAYFAEAE